MRALYIPTAVLVGLLVVSHWTGSHVQGRCEQWLELLGEARSAAALERWAAAEDRLDRVREAWERDGAFLRTVMEHDDLDEAEACLAGAAAACRQSDSVEFFIHLEQLQGKLVLLAQTQVVNIQNIL